MEVTQAPVESYQKEAREILAVAKNLRGKVENVDDLAASAISEGKTVEQFRAIALDKLPAIKPLEKPLLSEVKERDWGRYSLTRAINAKADGKELDGFEREISDEMAVQTGQKAQGFWLPGQVLARNHIAGGVTVSANTVGGVISTAQNMASEFIEVLRNKAKVLALGARVLNLNSAVTIPRQYAAGTANWTNGETAAATLTGMGLQQITLQPYAITAVQQYSKQLLSTSNPSVDSLVRDDINNIIALAIDRAALHGAGASGEPLGIAGTTGINTVSVAMLAASALTTSLYPFLVSLENEIAVDNADIGAMGYLMRPTEKSACKVTARFASTNTPVWEGNEVNGYRAEASNQIATNLTTGTATTICTAIFFGVWSELLLAQFNGGATDLVVDPYSLSLNRVIRLVASRWVDIGVRHPAAFCVGGGLIA